MEIAECAAKQISGIQSESAGRRGQSEIVGISNQWRAKRNSCAFISTRRARKRTPSLSRRSRWSMAESPRSLTSPPAPNTRCQGNPNERCRTPTTCRAAPGYPAPQATAPYVETFPRGIRRIAATMRTCILFGSTIAAARWKKFLLHLFCDFLAQAFGDHDSVSLHINHNWTVFGRPRVPPSQGLKNIQILHSILAILVRPTVTFLQRPGIDRSKIGRLRRARPAGYI